MPNRGRAWLLRGLSEASLRAIFVDALVYGFDSCSFLVLVSSLTIFCGFLQSRTRRFSGFFSLCLLIYLVLGRLGGLHHRHSYMGFSLFSDYSWYGITISLYVSPDITTDPRLECCIQKHQQTSLFQVWQRGLARCRNGSLIAGGLLVETPKSRVGRGIADVVL